MLLVTWIGVVAAMSNQRRNQIGIIGVRLVGLIGVITIDDFCETVLDLAFQAFLEVRKLLRTCPASLNRRLYFF